MNLKHYIHSSPVVASQDEAPAFDSWIEPKDSLASSSLRCHTGKSPPTSWSVAMSVSRAWKGRSRRARCCMFLRMTPSASTLRA